ncbi:4Fe-4S dicluster domain-containing protein [Pseudodesulfovibrio cashew]|uniref:4Fe-4S dicluster domain-containing protein n=1 Tax=Pseudodesulfovibrio cashew TaxID=2678688 RepID=A0A6I6JGV0_9BACT|nr:nitroreductase family protein [Pseudodesulfovibrio cashew]QGY39733.1 4Fe-4S dicluster domain-containing protein [Pseudodesulfovibrio cashew]
MFADKEMCKRCGACLSECPYQLIVEDKEGFPKLRPAARKTCIACGHCVAVCPTGSAVLPEMPVAASLTPEQCGKISRDMRIAPEEADQFLRSRRSIRSYKDKTVPEDVIADILAVAGYAPSAKNGQPADWIVTRDPEVTRELAGLTVRFMAINNVYPGLIKNWEKGVDKILHGAPHVALAHASDFSFHPAEDCSLAAAYLELAAHARGIGACWAGFLMEAAQGCQALRDKLDLPEGHSVHAALMFGYPKFRYQRIPRRKDISLRWLD